jgi:hypothetical protein
MSSSDIDAASEQFRLAIVADPTFADAYSGRALMLFYRVSIDPQTKKPILTPELTRDLRMYLALKPNGASANWARTVLENQPLHASVDNSTATSSTTRSGSGSTTGSSSGSTPAESLVKIQYQGAPPAASQGLVGLWSCFTAQSSSQGAGDEDKVQFQLSSDGTYTVHDWNHQEGEEQTSKPGRYEQSGNELTLYPTKKPTAQGGNVWAPGFPDTMRFRQDGQYLVASGSEELENNSGRVDWSYRCAKGDYFTANLGKRWVFRNNGSDVLYLDLSDGDASSTGSSCDNNAILDDNLALQPGEAWVQFCGSHAGFCFRPHRGDDTYMSHFQWYGAPCAGNEPGWQQDRWVREAPMP